MAHFKFGEYRMYSSKIWEPGREPQWKMPAAKSVMVSNDGCFFRPSNPNPWVEAVLWSRTPVHAAVSCSQVVIRGNTNLNLKIGTVPVQFDK